MKRASLAVLAALLMGNVTRLGPACPVVTLDFAAPGPGGCDEIIRNESGALENDFCLVGPPPVLEKGVTVACFVSAPNTITVRRCCHLKLCGDPKPQAYRFLVLEAPP